MKLPTWNASLVPLVLSCCLSCGQKDNDPQDDRLLAKVYNKELRLSALEGMFPEGTTRGDSVLIINAFAQRWIRETLLLSEAERSLPKDMNVDKLVRDYRASLIKNNYEQVLVEQLLDSTVTQEELNVFYERNKEQYQLETSILRCFFVKLPLDAPGKDSLNRWWAATNDRNLERMERYCKRYSPAFNLKEATWSKIDDIASQLPSGTLTMENVSSRREFTLSDEDFKYYFRLIELKNSREIAPLGFIEEQARKYILHQRKIKLLEQKREDLYQLALRKKDIQFFMD
ncbi:MAG: hypothetical protein RL386_1880 [Bacteroidota bacterium]|jgi:hypothetical protein